MCGSSIREENQGMDFQSDNQLRQQFVVQSRSVVARSRNVEEFCGAVGRPPHHSSSTPQLLRRRGFAGTALRLFRPTHPRRGAASHYGATGNEFAS